MLLFGRPSQQLIELFSDRLDPFRLVKEMRLMSLDEGCFLGGQVRNAGQDDDRQPREVVLCAHVMQHLHARAAGEADIENQRVNLRALEHGVRGRPVGRFEHVIAEFVEGSRQPHPDRLFVVDGKNRPAKLGRRG